MTMNFVLASDDEIITIAVAVITNVVTIVLLVGSISAREANPLA